VDYIERGNFLLKHANHLKRLAYQFNLVVIVLNNVISEVGQQDGGAAKGFFEQKSKHHGSVPALGLIWSNCVNDRVCLKKHGQADNLKRTMVIENSSYMRKSEIEFEIGPAGLRAKS